MRWTTLTFCALLAAATPRIAAAQSTTPSTATTGRGALAVVGMSVPNGETELGVSFSRALREAARAAGYQVSDDAPALDQAFALVGCSTTTPDCLALIADDLHAQRFVYGQVRRAGAGALDVSMNVEINIWDQATRRELTPETRTVPRAQLMGQPGALRELALQMLTTLVRRDDAAREEALRAQQSAAQQAQQTLAVVVAPPVLQPPRAVAAPSPMLRWVGFGLIGAGVVVGALGVWQWTQSSGYSSESLDGQGSYGAGWASYDNSINPPVNGVRRLSVDEVCAQAAGDANTMPDAAQADQMCKSNSSSRALAWGLGLGGLALAGAGTALVIVDMLRRNNAAREGAPPAQARVQVSPLIGPTLGGVSLGLRF